MKKTLVASLLGLTACTAAFGQGVIIFSNYISTQYNQVTWGIGPMAGQPVTDPNVEVQLFWALGNVTSEGKGTFYSTANAGVTTFIDPSITLNGGGYYIGPNQILTGWTPGQTVTFGVEGWEAGPGHVGTFASSAGLEGQTALWTEVQGATASSNGIQPSSNPPRPFNDGPPSLVLTDPEPSQFALSALGTAAFVFSRRKKKVPVSTGHLGAPKSGEGGKQLTTDD